MVQVGCSEDEMNNGDISLRSNALTGIRTSDLVMLEAQHATTELSKHLRAPETKASN